MVRAILFSNKRVGSTFLQQAINLHTQIIGIDEVFVNICNNRKIRKSGFVPYVISDVNTPGEYIEDIINKTYPDTNTIFKLQYSFSDMMSQIDYHKGLYDYINESKIPIIQLVRRNILKQVISFRIQQKNNFNVNVTPEYLLEKVKEIKKLNEKWKKELKDNIKLVLYYEDIIGDTYENKTYLSNNANIAVSDFFKVKPEKLFSDTKKERTKHISNYIPNYDKVKKLFENTEFDWMVK